MAVLLPHDPVADRSVEITRKVEMVGVLFDSNSDGFVSAPDSVFLGSRRDLDAVVEGIAAGEAAAAAPGPLEAFGLERPAHARFVPIRDRIGDVVDDSTRRRLRRGGGARDDERAALARLRTEHQVRPLAVVLPRRALHAE